MRAKMTQSCDESSTTPSTASFLTLLTKQGNLKNCCDVLTLETQCTSGLSAELKELREKLADREKTDATLESTPRGRGGKQATAAEKRLNALKVELANAGAAHVQLVDLFARSECNAVKVWADLESCKARLGKVKKALKLATDRLDDA